MVTVSPPVEVGSPKLRRRLTTTIDPSPALIPHLEQLSRTNNRPLSNCEDLNWEGGEDMVKEGEADEGLEITPRRPVVPASLLQVTYCSKFIRIIGKPLVFSSSHCQKH